MEHESDNSREGLKGDSPDYQQRIVAFIDVLGFSELVKQSGIPSNQERSSAGSKIGKLITTVKAIEHFIDNVLNDDRPDKFAEGAFFSDSFVISMKTDQLLYLIRETGNLCRHLLRHGLLCRGAITTGMLHHHHRIVVGPAFIKAYELERSAAVYPRIVFDDPTMEQWREELTMDSSRKLATMVKEDRDGLQFIDIFSPEWTGVLDPYDDLRRWDAKEFLEAVFDPIQDGLTGKNGSAKVRAKYAWLATQYNEYAAAFGMKRVSTSG